MGKEGKRSLDSTSHAVGRFLENSISKFHRKRSVAIREEESYSRLSPSRDLSSVVAARNLAELFHRYFRGRGTRIPECPPFGRARPSLSRVLGLGNYRRREEGEDHFLSLRSSSSPEALLWSGISRETTGHHARYNRPISRRFQQCGRRTRTGATFPRFP